MIWTLPSCCMPNNRCRIEVNHFNIILNFKQQVTFFSLFFFPPTQNTFLVYSWFLVQCCWRWEIRRLGKRDYIFLGIYQSWRVNKFIVCKRSHLQSNISSDNMPLVISIKSLGLKEILLILMINLGYIAYSS